MKRVYICHPYRNDPKGNLEKVRQIVIDISMQSVEVMKKNKGQYLVYKDDGSVCPVSPMLSFPYEMTEYSGNNISEEQGMAFCLSLLDTCEELWVYSDLVSKGMKTEIEYATKKGIKVVWKV